MQSSLLKTEFFVFHIQTTFSPKYKKIVTQLKKKKKIHKHHRTENLCLWWRCSYTTVYFCFRNCKALLRIWNADTRYPSSLGGGAALPEAMTAITIPFFHIKRSHFIKLLDDNFPNTAYRQKGIR